jgi:hypothetical protein
MILRVAPFSMSTPVLTAGLLAIPIFTSAMADLVWLLAFLLVLLGGFSTFLCLELIAMRNYEDNLHTLSHYIIRLRRRAGRVGSFVLTLVIASVAVWLVGHLVLEWW